MISVPPASQYAQLVCAPYCSNVAGEVSDIAAYLPPNRRLLVGFYLTGHGSLGSTTPTYVRNMLLFIAPLLLVDHCFLCFVYFIYLRAYA